MKTLDSTLWQQINSFDLTASDCQISFEEKLAQENGWTHGFATLVTAEYRKFLYLTQVAGHMVCPSDEVDQAWHLHLTQTASYFAFCIGVLGEFLHHHASKGGASELRKHQDMYSRTLESYEFHFDHRPDPDLWPSVKDRFFKFPTMINPAAFAWNRSFLFQHTGLGFTLMLIAGAGISMMLGGTLLPAVSGPEFLVWFLIVMTAICWIPTTFAKVGPLGLTQKALDPYEVAYLEGGANRVFGTAIASLVDKGALTLVAQRAQGNADITGAECLKSTNFNDASNTCRHTLEKKLFTEWPAQEADSQAPLVIAPQINDIHQRLVNAGLVLGTDKITRLRGLTVVLLMCLVMIGATRFWCGLFLNHNVLVLAIGMLICLVVIKYHVNAELRTTTAGAAVLQDLRNEYIGLKTTACDPKVRHQLTSTGTGTLLALGFALFGSQAVMATEDFAGINWVIGTENNTGNSNGTGGCGGGCGGCGGCGG